MLSNMQLEFDEYYKHKNYFFLGFNVYVGHNHHFSSLINLRAFFRDDQAQPAALHADPKDGHPAECRPTQSCVGCLTATKRSNVQIVPKFQHAALHAEEVVAAKGANVATKASAKQH